MKRGHRIACRYILQGRRCLCSLKIEKFKRNRFLSQTGLLLVYYFGNKMYLLRLFLDKMWHVGRNTTLEMTGRVRRRVLYEGDNHI